MRLHAARPRCAERSGAPAGTQRRTSRSSCWRAPTMRCSAAASGARATWIPSWTRRRPRAAPRPCSATSSRRTRAQSRAPLRPRVPYPTIPYPILSPGAPAARAGDGWLAAACALACRAGGAAPERRVLVRSCSSGWSRCCLDAGGSSGIARVPRPLLGQPLKALGRRGWLCARGEQGRQG